MAKFIVNTGERKEVHKATHTKPDCNIDLIGNTNRIDTYVDYTILYPDTYTTCSHCYNEAPLGDAEVVVREYAENTLSIN
ncbi:MULTISPECIES: hypothetical protein [Bacillaceae]|uniref:Uncharacterized protein n=1 Tax=Evansella alkalicola TaxID=745819 RepID=A0ABS6JPT5_9BACI|nr:MULTISPECIES: hypothetical protein [Bacillaceae]MBU9720576.1 hypothetical protein [Bacillus alkalicola]